MPLPKKQRKYIIDNEVVMRKWDKEKNRIVGLDPTKLTVGSHSYANFICPDCGDKWYGMIRDAVRYNGCKQCMRKARSSNNIMAKLKNGKSLFESNPELEKEWDYKENDKNGLNPKYIMAGTSKEANWICPKGHRYKAYISNRATKHTGCTFCAGQDILVGFNDLATVRPDLLKEWDYEKNAKIGLTPENVMKGSHNVVNWICPIGHEYVKAIKLRTSGQGCTECAKESQTSFPEQAIYYYMKKIFNDNVLNRYGNPEIDIFISPINFGIEYDGLFAHKNKKSQEQKKDDILKSRKIELIRVKEVRKIQKDTDKIIYCVPDNNYEYLSNVIHKILEILKIKYGIISNTCIDVKNDRIKIEEQYINSLKENSILVKKPKLAKEWDYKENGKIKPEYISYGSSKKYYWICEKGHSYEYVVKKKDIGKGCPFCEGRKLLKGFNDLESKYPMLLDFWDYKKNEKMPSEVKYNDRNKYYWKCNKGHSYTTTIEKRLKGTKCTICSGREVIQGINDLQTLRPDLIEEWDFKKNTILSPNKVAASSNKSAFWICSKCGYQWESIICNRKKCPKCTQLSKIINLYDFETMQLLYSFKNMKELCKELDIDFKKQHANISYACNSKQKTLLHKYIVRYDIDDELKLMNLNERNNYKRTSLYKSRSYNHKKINIPSKNEVEKYKKGDAL